MKLDVVIKTKYLKFILFLRKLLSNHGFSHPNFMRPFITMDFGTESRTDWILIELKKPTDLGLQCFQNMIYSSSAGKKVWQCS